MSEKTKETPITIDDKEYIIENMTQEQQVMVNHIADLDRKINSSLFNLDQLQFGKQAFVAELKRKLEEPEEETAAPETVAA